MGTASRRHHRSRHRLRNLHGAVIADVQVGMSSTRTFTYRSARSGGLLAGIILVLVSEGIGIHLWAAKKNVAVAFALTAMTLSAIAWLALDYVSLGSGSIELTDDMLSLHIGRRFNLDLPRSAIASSSRSSCVFVVFVSFMKKIMRRRSSRGQ